MFSYKYISIRPLVYSSSLLLNLSHYTLSLPPGTMEYARSAFARPAPTLARTALPRIAPSTIASIAMDDLRPKNMACSGIGEASAPIIIAQWAAWRQSACQQMLHNLDRRDRDSQILALTSLQAVSTMVDASFLRQPILYGWEPRRHVVVTRELNGLAEHRAVSAFVHRECIEVRTPKSYIC